MRLVDSNVLETKLFERRLLNEANLVAGDTDFEILWNEPIRDNLSALFLGSCKDDYVEVGSPLFELARPVLKGRLRDDNQVRPRDREVMLKIGKKRNCLKCFAQALEVLIQQNPSIQEIH